jgi:hypothetical protein
VFAYSAVYAVMFDSAMMQDARYGRRAVAASERGQGRSIGTIGGAIYLPRINR